ncbi:MAG TPA: hypothetical protein VFO39_06150 [Candidatus Sulfotelmatobacter sp.]|nr:hypothetical protein [Candidatus Sulfotelmatobacter sp.]
MAEDEEAIRAMCLRLLNANNSDREFAIATLKAAIRRYLDKERNLSAPSKKCAA